MAINFEKLVKSITMPLVVHPDAVLVKILSEDEEIINIQLVVHEADLGRVIGKGGKIASAIRTIIYAGAAKEGRKIHLEIDAF
ncbi:conserved hypothetical protein [Alteracholeplasma palmae J233]|uniref:RNA-binding protein KhpA n=1 Tax=Alteracholeplasma palmae (strain ATCC 49389 / J233) TaxID=1318466 RepID=U4KK06_ALTPJ|nr:KH domain-containing protein [Alteracholeplasma palmae]CCV63828.1 conserved hypothetical protein [Alteracholeplasma palmae J233]